MLIFHSFKASGSTFSCLHHRLLNSFKEAPLTCTLTNSEDTGEMPHFHQGLHCSLKQNQSSEKAIQYFGELKPANPKYK